MRFKKVESQSQYFFGLAGLEPDEVDGLELGDLLERFSFFFLDFLPFLGGERERDSLDEIRTRLRPFVDLGSLSERPRLRPRPSRPLGS